MSTSLSGSVVVAGIERTWRAIQERHAELPDAIVIVGQGARGSRELKLGHWWASRWRRVRGKPVGEVFIAGEIMKPGLRRDLFGSEGSREKRVLSTLLHEAAHALGYARGIQDTSRQGRYHNTRFKGLAEELGLAVAKTPTAGWNDTTLGQGTAALYKKELGPLKKALAGYCPMPDASDGEDNKPKKGLQKLICSCDPMRISYMTRSQFERGEVSCEVCESSFTLDK